MPIGMGLGKGVIMTLFIFIGVVVGFRGKEKAAMEDLVIFHGGGYYLGHAGVVVWPSLPLGGLPRFVRH